MRHRIAGQWERLYMPVTWAHTSTELVLKARDASNLATHFSQQLLARLPALLSCLFFYSWQPIPFKLITVVRPG